MVELYDDIPEQILSLEEFHNALVWGYCTTEFQRNICRDICRVRPGWVNNVQIAQKIETFLTKKSVWGVDNPTEKDLVKALRYEVSDNLDMIEILAVIREYTDKQ